LQTHSQNARSLSSHRRGRPRKTTLSPAVSKVGYDPNPTIIDDPPECDESVAPAKPTQRRPNPNRLPQSAQFGVGDIPESEVTPSRAPEISTPLPDFSDPSYDENPKMEPHFPKDMGGGKFDMGGEDFDMDASALRNRIPYLTRPNPFDPTDFRLPSRSVAGGVDSPVRRRTPPLPEAPVLPGAVPFPVDERGAKRFDSEKEDRPCEKGKCKSKRDRCHSLPDGKEYYRDGELCGWLSDPEYGNAPMGNDREQFHCISIIGQIEGHSLLPEGQKATKYEHIIPTLVSVEEDDRVDGLLVILNTMGGDVEAGLAIAEMIASMTKPTVSLVLGGGHSIGVPLATAADYSLIVPSATMTIHPVRVSGMVIGVPQSFRYMSEMQDRITKFICSHSKAKPEVIHELMMRPDQIATDCGSILEGDEAVRYGIIDEVGGLDRALTVLRELCKQKKK